MSTPHRAATAHTELASCALQRAHSAMARGTVESHVGLAGVETLASRESRHAPSSDVSPGRIL